MIQNPVPWPNGARCAVAITFDMDADSLIHLRHHRSAHTRVSATSMLRYGPEVAIPRLCEIFRQHEIKQTFFVPAWCVEHYPRAVETILKGGHEIGHHGYIHEEPNSLPADQQLYWMQRSTEILKSATGHKPKGYRAPAYQFSCDTLGHLLDEGFTYDSSMMGDDVPYLLKNNHGQIVELPSHIGLDDWPHYTVSRELDYRATIKPPAMAAEVYKAEFDAMWEYGGLWIGIWHPFVSGRISRAVEISRLIQYMKDKGNVWFARLDEIAEHVSGLVERGEWQPRVDNIPYYDAPLEVLGKADPELAS